MNERLEAMKQSVLASLRRARIFYSAHRGLLLSGLTILSILLIVWARFGFTLQFSQFFAYQGGGECNRAGNTFCKNGDVWEYQDDNGTCVSSLYEDCVAPKTCVANGTSASCQAASTPTPTPTGGGGPTPTPTPTGGGVCADNTNCSACSGVTQARKDCEGNNSTTRNGIGKNDGTEPCSWWKSDGQNWCNTCPYLYRTAKAPKGAAAGDNSVATWAAAGVSQQNLCQEKPDDCPSGWHAWSSSWCEQNSTAPPATPTPTPTPTATKTPTPSPTVSPTVTPTATATASATPVPTTTATLSPSPTTTATTMPAPILAYSIGVSGRNVTVTSVQASSVQLQVGQQAEVIIAVRNTSYTQNSTAGALAPLSNVVVRAVLPTGLEYIAESTSVSGVPTTIDSITTGGLALGTIAPQQEVAVVFRIRAVTSQFVVGTTQTSIVVSATVANANQQTATLPVTVTRATAGVPGTVKTGPGDAVLVALLMSAIVTLLYVSYTHTSAYKRKEIEAITQGRDPMDFRS